MIIYLLYLLVALLLLSPQGLQGQLDDAVAVHGLPGRRQRCLRIEELAKNGCRLLLFEIQIRGHV